MPNALRNQFHVQAVEMEGSGVADATWELEKSYLVVSDTCDYCNPTKADISVNEGFNCLVEAAVPIQSFVVPRVVLVVLANEAPTGTEAQLREPNMCPSCIHGIFRGTQRSPRCRPPFQGQSGTAAILAHAAH